MIFSTLGLQVCIFLVVSVLVAQPVGLAPTVGIYYLTASFFLLVLPYHEFTVWVPFWVLLSLVLFPQLGYWPRFSEVNLYIGEDSFQLSLTIFWPYVPVSRFLGECFFVNSYTSVSPITFSTLSQFRDDFFLAALLNRQPEIFSLAALFSASWVELEILLSVRGFFNFLWPLSDLMSQASLRMLVTWPGFGRLCQVWGVVENVCLQTGTGLGLWTRGWLNIGDFGLMPQIL